MYFGSTSVGAPALNRELSTMVIRKLAVGPMDNNVYLLRCTATGEQLLIDAADESNRILDLVGGDDSRAEGAIHTDVVEQVEIMGTLHDGDDLVDTTTLREHRSDDVVLVVIRALQEALDAARRMLTSKLSI